MLTSEARRLRARLAATRRHHPDADLSALSAELTAHRLVDDVTRYAARLSPQQRARIGVALIAPPEDPSGLDGPPVDDPRTGRP